MKRTRDLARITISLFRQTIRIGNAILAINAFYRNPLLQFSLRYREYEPGMNAVLRACFEGRRGALVDVGANIGQTFLKLLEIDKDREYIGFEPQLYGAFLIDDFIAKNELTNKVVLPVGLSDTSGIAKLGVSCENDPAASFVDEYRPSGFYSAYRSIATMKGDDVLKSLGAPAVAVIKIDVEGAELEVIRGFRNTIIEHKPYILFEVLPHFLFKTHAELDEETRRTRVRRHREIKNQLGEMGYTLFVISSRGVAETESIEAASREKRDYLAVPHHEALAFGSS